MPYNWIKKTKKTIEKFKDKGLPMSFILPLETATQCSRCEIIIPATYEKIHELYPNGKIEVFCDDDCWGKQVEHRK